MASGLTRGSTQPLPTRSIAIGASPAGRLASNPASVGPGDPRAPRLKFSSVASLESNSISRFNSSLSGDISQSSRSSALPRISRFAHLSVRPTYPSVRIDSILDAVGGAGRFAAPETSAAVNFAVLDSHLRASEPVKMPRIVSLDQHTDPLFLTLRTSQNGSHDFGG